MSKRKIVILVILIFIGILSVRVALEYFEDRQLAFQQHHLLCEVLKPRMTKEEVLDTLRMYGEISVVGDDNIGSSFAIHIVFMDPKVKEVYGVFDLQFVGYQYYRAFIEGFETQETICLFPRDDWKVAETPTS